MSINVEVPGMGESVNEATLLRWHKQDGEYVKQDEPLAEMETDKANLDVPAPSAGVIKRITHEGSKVKIGDIIATIDAAAKPAEKTKVHDKTPAAATQQITPPATPGSPATPSLAAHPPEQHAASEDGKEDSLSPAVRRMVSEHKLDAAQISGTGRGGRVTKEDVVNYMDKQPAVEARSKPAPATLAPETSAPVRAASVQEAPAAAPSVDGIRRVPMSKIRKRIAENLVRANQTAAILTTFNEVDMSAVMELRSKYKERFEKQHQIGLGFMSFFAKACCQALREFERVNASIDGDDVVYHDYVNLGIAVSTDRGLAVPVLRNAHELSFAKIESEIKRLALATRDGKLGLNELSGGTFTITNGGIFGSMLSTPILNTPQSAILGMHNIVKRAVVVNDEIVIRPMMYLALSYDHRLIDGRESVTFLVRVKELLEDPTRLMLEV